MKNRMGFTLIELMVVIVIIGILASAGMPTYRNRIVRTKIKTSMTYADVAIEAVETFYKANKRFPNNNKEAQIPEADKFIGKYVNSVSIDSGAVTVTFIDKLYGLNDKKIKNVLSIRPAFVLGEPLIPLTWVYGNSQVPAKLIVRGENKTSFDSQALPFEYREWSVFDIVI